MLLYVLAPQAELQHQLMSAEEAWVPRVAAAQREASAAEACLWQGRLQAAQQALQAAATRGERLQAELQSARAGVPWTPRAQEVSGTDRKNTSLCLVHTISLQQASWYLIWADDARQLPSKRYALLIGVMLAVQDGEWQAAYCSTAMPRDMLPACIAEALVRLPALWLSCVAVCHAGAQAEAAGGS